MCPAPSARWLSNLKVTKPTGDGSVVVVTDEQTAALLGDYQLSRLLFGALRQVDNTITAMHVVTADIYEFVVNEDVVITDVDVKK